MVVRYLFALVRVLAMRRHPIQISLETITDQWKKYSTTLYLPMYNHVAVANVPCCPLDTYLYRCIVLPVLNKINNNRTNK